MARHWIDDERRELVTLWPTKSVLQIANRRRRPRESIRGQVKRLLKEGLLESYRASGASMATKFRSAAK